MLGEKAAVYFGAGMLQGSDIGIAIDAALVTAQALMDQTFERSGYDTVPVDPPSARTPTPLAAVLKRYCCIGAVHTQLPRLEGVESGMEKAIEEYGGFMNAVLLGTENLPGLDRGTVEEEKLVAGRIGFAGSGERNHVRREFRGWGNLLGS